MTTAEKVRALIEKRNKSQREFAKEAGIHYVTLNKCLSDDKFSMKSLNKIADYQGVTLTSLMPDKRVKKIPVTPVINGYIEYDGKIEAIRSIEDLERIWNYVSKNTNHVSKSTKASEKSSTKKREQEQTEIEKPKYTIKCSDEGYAYFYMDVPLSNWWDSVPAIQFDGHTFNASESIFMYLKAKCFGDDETAAKIVEKDNKTYAHPKSRWNAVKMLGGKVEGFDFGKWAKKREDAMYTVLKQKALYDEEFKKVVEATGYQLTGIK